MWDPADELIDAQPAPGCRVWVAGSIQRRFWSGEEGRRSRLELIADQVCVRGHDDED
jgi:single-stranded DNA-binding protein